MEALVALRHDVARWLLRRDIQQWLPDEFSAARMQAWVERGDVFVHRQDGRVVAAIAVLDEDPEIWTTIMTTPRSRRWYQARRHRVVGHRAFKEAELFDSVLLEKTLS